MIDELRQPTKVAEYISFMLNRELYFNTGIDKHNVDTRLLDYYNPSTNEHLFFILRVLFRIANSLEEFYVRCEVRHGDLYIHWSKIRGNKHFN